MRRTEYMPGMIKIYDACLYFKIIIPIKDTLLLIPVTFFMVPATFWNSLWNPIQEVSYLYEVWSKCDECWHQHYLVEGQAHKNITVCLHPPYSWNWHHVTSGLSLKVKVTVNGKHIEFSQNSEAATTGQQGHLWKRPPELLQHVVEMMGKCLWSDGEYSGWN